MQRVHKLKSSGPFNPPAPGGCANRRAGVGLHRRNLAVRRIDHKPRPAAPAHFVDVAELGRISDLAFRIAAEEFRVLERVLLTLRRRVGDLPGRDVFEAPARELLRTLERRAVLVLVRVVALQIRIAPRRSGGRERARLGAWRRGRSLLRRRGCGTLEILRLIDAAPPKVLRDLRIRTERPRAIDRPIRGM